MMYTLIAEQPVMVAIAVSLVAAALCMVGCNRAVAMC